MCFTNSGQILGKYLKSMLSGAFVPPPILLDFHTSKCLLVFAHYDVMWTYVDCDITMG